MNKYLTHIIEDYCIQVSVINTEFTHIHLLKVSINEAINAEIEYQYSKIKHTQTSLVFDTIISVLVVILLLYVNNCLRIIYVDFLFVL